MVRGRLVARRAVSCLGLPGRDADVPDLVTGQQVGKSPANCEREGQLGDRHQPTGPLTPHDEPERLPQLHRRPDGQGTSPTAAYEHGSIERPLGMLVGKPRVLTLICRPRHRSRWVPSATPTGREPP